MKFSLIDKTADYISLRRNKKTVTKDTVGRLVAAQGRSSLAHKSRCSIVFSKFVLYCS